ncbi:hypothetical protein E3N88_10759 [Mikania micrantha]|uniref:C2 NT-type domain-containing protein n=1 Tax=Mikania micrantha TaxID=192012 RepID=A0A5N6PCI3_9ASTR|nr:hypothetical protein E3N88_10759 [Mikania micrantha]
MVVVVGGGVGWGAGGDDSLDEAAGTQEFAVHGCAVMLRTTKWKLEKTKVKVVFRLQFHATNIPQSGWDKLFICFIPIESGKIIAKTSKANVRNGSCKWADPIYETTRLLVDSRNKRYDDKFYNLIVGMGTTHASILGEATINLADYADALNPFLISLPLHGSDQGTILHVTIQLLTAKTGFREFEQQFDKGLQSSSNYSQEVEHSIATPSSSDLQIFDDHENKVNTRIHFRSEFKDLTPIIEEPDIHQDFSDSSIEYNGQCNNSESYNANRHGSSGIHESRELNRPVNNQISTTENTDHSKDNNLAIALEENHRLKGSLKMAESFICELKQELNTLHSHANEMNMETQKIAQHLTDEISSGFKLEREVMMLRSEFSKFKDELQQLSEIKLRSQYMDKTPNQRVNELFLVEGRIREIQKKIHIGFHESDLSFINSDLEMLLGIVQNLETGMGFIRGVDLGESQSSELLRELNEAKIERGNLVKKMNEMECYYESLVQELEENRERILVEFQKLRYEHLTCINTISTCKSETESIRLCMKDQILKFDKERLALNCVNEELEKRVMVAEAFVQELEENRDQIVKEFDSLKNEHLTCGFTISSCKYETESIREIESIHGDLKDQTLKFAKEKHDLGCVKEQLDKRVKTAEALVQELEEKKEQILGEFLSLRNEHSTCGDTILTYNNMNNQILRLEKERHDLGCVNEQLKKRVMTLETHAQQLEEKQEQILGEFQSLKNKHLTCDDTILTYKSEIESIRHDLEDQILEYAKEKHALSCVNKELEKRVLELEENREQILEDFQGLKNEHSTCGDAISTCKTETECLRVDMNNQILNITEEKHVLSSVKKELEKRVSELEETREQILGDFQSLKNEHSACEYAISTCKTEAESICVDMNNQILKLTEEKHDLNLANKELEERVASLESALERGRLSYSIAVTQLQKDLDMLSDQVSSMFETNQNLIRQKFSPENCTNIAQNLCGKDDFSDELYEICLLEQPSESLRIAFMKEQCETMVQELKQQLFVSKRHGDDILIKLQDALDEIESRKKSEASYLKKIEELLLKIRGLDSELQSMQVELDCALLNLECCREEKERIAAQIIELEKMKNKRSILTMMTCESTFQDFERELMQLHKVIRTMFSISCKTLKAIVLIISLLVKANEELEGMYPRFKDFMGDGNALGRVLALEIELAGALMVKKNSSVQFQSSFLKQHTDEEAIFKSFRDINELIKDTLEIKSRYVNVETELNEMHTRYTQLSLQLAEVEGERQKLMMIVKNMR